MENFDTILIIVNALLLVASEVLGLLKKGPNSVIELLRVLIGKFIDSRKEPEVDELE